MPPAPAPAAAAYHRWHLQCRRDKVAVQQTKMNHVVCMFFFLSSVPFDHLSLGNNGRTAVCAPTFVMSTTKQKRLSLPDKLKILQRLGQWSKVSGRCKGLWDSTIDVVNDSEAKDEAWRRNCKQSQQETTLHGIFQASGQCCYSMALSQQQAVPEKVQKNILSGQLCHFMSF